MTAFRISDTVSSAWLPQLNDRQANRQETKVLFADFDVLVMFGGAAGTFDVEFAGNEDDGREMMRKVQRLAMDMGMCVDVLGSRPAFMGGRWSLSVWVTEMPESRKALIARVDELRGRKGHEVKATTPVLNTERKMIGRRIVVNPVNLAFEPKEKRVETLRRFIIADAFVSADGLDTAFVNRLFDEGMIERHPNADTFRATVGGKVWFNASR